MHFSKFLNSIIAILLLLSSYGCQGGGSGSSKQQENIIPSTLREVTGDGGVVSLKTDTLYAKAVFPKGALSETTAISISAPSSLPQSLPYNNAQAGNPIQFKPEETIFKKAVTLGIPVSRSFLDANGIDINEVKVKYYSQRRNLWVDMPVKSRDENDNIIYFESGHFSTYISYVERNDPTDPQFDGLLEHEYFIGQPQIHINDDGTVELAKIERPYYIPWHLRVFKENTEDESEKLFAIIDRNFTKNNLSGYQYQISEDGASITFDSAEIFDKIKKSGDARLWKWDCQFVKELTHLRDYKVFSDDDPPVVTNNPYIKIRNNKIYAEITPLNETDVKISWGIDVTDQLITGAAGLAIRFEARYNPNGQEE